MAELYINQTVRGSVVLPFVLAGTTASLFSVFTQVIVCAAAEKSYILIRWSCQLVALVVVRVIVKVAAELFVTL